VSDSTIPERWLPVTRVTWFALVVLLLAAYGAGIVPYFNQLHVPCSSNDCLALALSPQEAQLLPDLGLSIDFYVGYALGINIVGFMLIVLMAGLVFWLRSSTWLGFLLSLALVFFGTFSAQSATAIARQYPNLAWPIFLLDASISSLTVMLFYLFPDGRFVPRWTRWLMIGLVAGFVVDLLLLNRGPLEPSYSTTAEIMYLGCLVVGILAQIYRYRRVSTPAQRQQTKWAMFGVITLFVMLLAWSLLFELFPPHSSSTRLATKLGLSIGVLLFTIFPLSIVISILRYRLWDIDIIIRKTLVYALITALLALVYFGVIVLLQVLFEAISGEQSAISIVISTLIIAALFSPVRRRVQDFIDRRFYRRRYDAEKTLAAFGQFVRAETDLETLKAELQRVVRETMQPEQVVIWLNRAAPAAELQFLGEGNLRPRE
jgi:hypothetical protein